MQITCKNLKQNRPLMKTSVTISLDKRKMKKDGTYPLVLLLVHHSKPLNISTGYSISESDWDQNKREVKKSYKGIESVTRLNNLLGKKKSAALEIITKLEEEKSLQNLTVSQIKQRIIGNKQININLFDYLMQHIEDLRKANQVGNAKTYKSLLTAMQSFLNQKDIPLNEINYDFLKRFEKEYLSRGNSVNGLSVYLRTLRALINKAIKEKVLDKNHYPFEDYSIKTIQTLKRSLTIDSIKSIVELKITPKDPLFETRNYFLASFYMMGISFIDLAFLQVSNLIDGRIRYQRKKTHKQYDIKVSENLSIILSYYLTGKKPSEFIFPIIKSDILHEQYRDIDWGRKKYNKWLKKLAERCGIKERLTSYVSRHSFATILKYNNVPVTAISEMLGHKDLKTTQIYLNSLPSEVIDSYNDLITKI